MPIWLRFRVDLLREPAFPLANALPLWGVQRATLFPKSGRILHFEVGLWLGPAFQKWYDVQNFDTPNDHGVYNGMNILGFDVWALLNAIRDGKADSVNDYFATLPTAVSFRVWNASIPDLLRAES